jgi:cytochrome c peroxidase
MWDGRKKSLEDQAMGPMLANVEMNMDIPKLMNYLQTQPVYKAGFEKAFGEPASEITVAKAIASFEPTIISTDSPFDQWINGDGKAMTKQQVEGFRLFVDPNKANCAACHSAPNFTDDGFHNVGLASWGNEKPDMGRYAQKPIGIMKGAFKTPTLRDITLTAPYFHDGSAATLNDVVEHYAKGGVVKTNLSPKSLVAAVTSQRLPDWHTCNHPLVQACEGG